MKKQLLLILGLMFTATIFAAPVTKDAAKKNVLSFLQGKKGNKMFATAGMNQAQLTQVDYKVSGDAFYVFNVGNNGGFVITAADDRVETILGYSYEGSFDPENVPENMKNWLEFYAKQINAVKDLNLAPSTKAYDDASRKEYRHAIPTMLTCKWNQISPYNDQCPKFPGDIECRPTGCVATAVAQVMYFHRWPQEAIPEISGYEYIDDPAYGGNNSTRKIPALKSTTINWDILEDEYNYNSTKESKNEVAKLMRYCGQALRMGYHPIASGSFTFDIPSAMRDFLGYDKGVKYLDKQGFSKYEWEDIVYDEILNGRPVLYSGMSKGAGGHQFVCDGYENEFFHFNWGWGGVSDGYFKLTLLNPNQEGVVGGNGLDFSDGQQIVIGVQPPVDGTVLPEDAPRVGSMLLTKNYDGEFKKNNLGKITIYLNSVFGFDSEHDAILSLGYGVYDANNNLIEVCKALDKQFITGGFPEEKVMTGSVSISKEALEKDGTYYLKCVVKNKAGQFVSVPGSDRTYFELNVQGENVHVTPYPIVNVAISDLRFDAPLYSGCQSVIKATIENKGNDIEATLILSDNGKVKTEQQMPISLRKGEKKEVSFIFYPMDSGIKKYGITVNGVSYADEIEADVKESKTISSNLSFVPTVNIVSSGNNLDIPVEVENLSTTNPYVAPIRASLYIKSGNNLTLIKSVMVPVELEASGKTTINAHFDDLAFNKFYHLSLSYYKYNRETYFGGTNSEGYPSKTFSRYQTADALSYYDELGNMNYKVVAEGETYDIPENACFVNLPKTISKRTINKSANTNCVYNVRPGVSTSQFAGCNIIKNDVSNEINLTDSTSFLLLEPAFVAKVNITINVESDKTALYLPFEPEMVTCDGVALTKANSQEELGSADYALIPFVAEDADKVYCGFNSLYTASPAVLVVKKELVGKPIVFTAERVHLDPSNNILKGDFFNIHSSNRTSAFTDPVYGYNQTNFSKEVNKIAPFRAYLTSVESADLQNVQIVYDTNTGIEEIESEEMTGKMVDVYTIDGVKVTRAQYGDKMLEGLPSGLYIVNGKKFVK